MEPQIPDSNIFREELDKNLDKLSLSQRLESLMINGFDQTHFFKHETSLGMFNLVTDLNLRYSGRGQ